MIHQHLLFYHPPHLPTLLSNTRKPSTRPPPPHQQKKSKMVEKSDEENMAVWLVAPNTLRILPLALPPLGPQDAKIRMKAVGICGSDVHYLKHMRCGGFEVREPMVMGHECAGIVEEVGVEVRGIEVGDRVALEPGVSCGRCRDCLGGRYNLCNSMNFFATPPTHGSLANLVVHPSHLCFKLPHTVTLEEGALCEPMSVGVHACRRALVSPDTNVLIFGAGPIGLFTMLVAMAFGAPLVVIVDVDPLRLSFAKTLGAHQALLISTSSSPQEVEKEVEGIKGAMKGRVDVSIDCVGVSKTMTSALLATSQGGKVCLVGMGHNEVTVPLASSVTTREVDIVGSFRYKNTWPLCLEMIQSGKVDLKPMITHRFGFSQSEVEEAFKTSAGGGDAIKVMFVM